jgi:holo-[acyl-carrier protein] synthase
LELSEHRSSCNHIALIEDTLERHGERFIKRCFSETELRRSEARAGRAASYAKRFAAKESLGPQGAFSGATWAS